MSDLGTRPDYAVTFSGALVGFIELKAPGKGADPERFKDPNDRDQWRKLKSLPNLIYADGNEFSLWRDGERVGNVVRLIGDIAGASSSSRTRRMCSSPTATPRRSRSACSWRAPATSSSRPACTRRPTGSPHRAEPYLAFGRPGRHVHSARPRSRPLQRPRRPRFPFWRDAAATVPNVRPALLAELGRRYGTVVSAEDFMAYVAAVAAHPAFTDRFRNDLVTPGLRIPITADAALFDEAAELGRTVIWLHTFGDRFADPEAGRPHESPKLPAGERPQIRKGGAIPQEPKRMPDDLDYDPKLRRLKVGDGYIDGVDREVWAYEVSGKQVLRQWFSYRKADRDRPLIGDRRPPSKLGEIQPDHWLAEYTSELIRVLNVLGLLVRLEPQQADLLERIVAGPTLSATDLTAAGAFAVPPGAQPKRGRGRKPPEGQGDLF